MTYFWQNPSATGAPSCACRIPNDHTMADVARLQFILDQLDYVFQESGAMPAKQRNEFRMLLNNFEREIKQLRRTACPGGRF